MFLYDTDAERVMQTKKREILWEIEQAKLRVLKELSNCDKVTLTRFYKMDSNFNEILTRLNSVDENFTQQLKVLKSDFTKVIQQQLPVDYIKEVVAQCVADYVAENNGGFLTTANVVDTVEDGNMNPVTSNAIHDEFSALGDLLEGI